MSDATDALLLKVLDGLEKVSGRLDALEAKPSDNPPLDSFPDWNEDPGSVPHLSVVPDPPASPEPPVGLSGAETATPAPRAMNPAQAAAQFQVPADSALVGGIKGDNGTMIRPPTSDQPIVAGGGPGMGMMSTEQLNRCYQREVVQARRMRPLEDASPRVG